MRFCLQETSCEQEDYFPPNIAVKVNGKLCPLPVSQIRYRFLFQYYVHIKFYLNENNKMNLNNKINLYFYQNIN